MLFIDLLFLPNVHVELPSIWRSSMIKNDKMVMLDINLYVILYIIKRRNKDSNPSKKNLKLNDDLYS